MDNFEYALKLLGVAAGTYFWLWYLTYEYELIKGLRKRTKWWERDLFRGKYND